MWHLLTNVEPIFPIPISSYFVVLLASLILLKKDLKTSLTAVFKRNGLVMVLIGLGFALLFQALWFLINFAVGSSFAVTPFPSLGGYENYAVYSITLGFAI